MQFLNSLFADNKLLTLGAAAIAFLIFAVFILLFVRLLFGNRLRMSGGRARQQRLGVVDAYDMDRQRQLVLVRRDNTEHLIMIGGPNDLLIESTILRVEEREGRNRAASLSRESASQESPRLPVADTRPIPFEPAPEPDPQPTGYGQPPVAFGAPPVPDAPAYPVPQEEAAVPIEAPTLAPPIPEPPARPKDPMRLPDLFARMRGNRTPPAPPAVPETPLAPLRPSNERLAPEDVNVSPAPAVADAALLESEIARALAPSLRGRASTPAAPPSSVPEPPAPPPPPPNESPVPAVAPAAPPTADVPRAPASGTDPLLPNMEAPLPPAEPVEEPVAPPSPPPPPIRPPPRPFRPFTPPPRREPSLGATPASGAPALDPATRPSRPPPPPFFSRMAQRTKERVEPPVVSQPAEAAPESSVAEPSPVLHPTRAADPAPAAPEPAPAPAVPASPPPPSPTGTAPQPAASAQTDATDPFEEEMARLLGRTPAKEN